MKLCAICGTRHHDYQGHVFASNVTTASNAASNKIVPQEGVRTTIPAAPPDTVSGAGTKQRWSREAYNRYQRDYMRKYRARIPS